MEQQREGERERSKEKILEEYRARAKNTLHTVNEK